MGYTFSDKLLILGAGSHVPYSFPSATDLKKEILDLGTRDVGHDGNNFMNFSLQPDSMERKRDVLNIMKSLDLIDFEPKSGQVYLRALQESLNKFIKYFGEAQVYSIDKYLANRGKSPEDQELKKIGKLLISYFIKYHEDQLNIGFRGDNWIQLIFKQYFDNKDAVESFFHAPPKIYTLNYDRFLEKSIFLHLVRQHNYSELEATEKVKQLKITHIYGDLGDFNNDDKDKIKFYSNAISRIKVVNEERDIKKLQDITNEITDKIHNSSAVYFLGYGFDEINNKILLGGYQSKGDPAKFYSTNIKLTPFRIDEITAELNNIYIDFCTNIKDCCCYKLLEEKVFLGQ